VVQLHVGYEDPPHPVGGRLIEAVDGIALGPKPQFFGSTTRAADPAIRTEDRRVAHGRWYFTGISIFVNIRPRAAFAAASNEADILQVGPSPLSINFPAAASPDQTEILFLRDDPPAYIRRPFSAANVRLAQ
jgi:hypothetical protein